MRPLLLDLFCCAGGASAGYVAAGYEVVGVDIVDQPKYPFKFYKGDALQFLRANYGEFQAVHASPPCQAYSTASMQFRVSGKTYPDLVSATRDVLLSTGVPWVIENVPGSPLINPVLLCGTMFGLRTYRHRLFETSFILTQPHHGEHKVRSAKMGRVPKGDEFLQIVGHFSGVPLAREIMGCPWMNQYELAQAIPPVYTKYVGAQMLKSAIPTEIAPQTTAEAEHTQWA